MPGSDGAQFQKRKQADFPGDAREFPDGLEVKLQGQMCAVKKKKMRADGRTERLIREREIRKRSVQVAMFRLSARIIFEKCVHRCSSDFSQVLYRGDVLPDELMGVFPGFFENRIEDLIDPVANLWRRVAVERVDGNDVSSPFREFGVEAGRSVTASQNSTLQILIGKLEHVPVFFEGTAPRDNFLQLKRHDAPFSIFLMEYTGRERKKSRTTGRKTDRTGGSRKEFRMRRRGG
jgi:hypothetical protein